MQIDRSGELSDAYPRAIAYIWFGRVVTDAQTELPSLHETASGSEGAVAAARNMTRFCRQLGGSGRSPVEFQIRKARSGELQYSHRNALVDYLLYAEIKTGFLIGLHDGDELHGKPWYGLAREASSPILEHISGKAIGVSGDEPVLLVEGRIVACLRHGPDKATRVTTRTRNVMGVLFASPSDERERAAAAATQVDEEGRARGLWK